jgi:hypothetical protein
MTFKSLFKAWGAKPAQAGAVGASTTTSRINVATALGRGRVNQFGKWHSAGSASDDSLSKTDASARLKGPAAQVKVRYDGPRLSLEDPVFTMGSCFARELEASLIRRGGRVVSMDYDKLRRPEFLDGEGRVRAGFFHRYTPQSMLQELQRAFDELPGWDLESSLLIGGQAEVHDLNYGWIPGADPSRAAAVARRRVAREFARTAAEAKVLILTLGLTESWLHKPSGLFCNKIHIPYARRHAGQFELHLTGVDDAVACLEGAYDVVRRHHRDGDFQFVVTVSPVPLQATFTDQDVIVANAESKAVLRAAAGAFCRRHDNVSYFPSYEMVTHSHPDFALRPDHAHVERAMVDRIMSSFIEAYFDRVPPALAEPWPDQDIVLAD